METQCSKCSYKWDTSSVSVLVTCPSCQLKTNRESGAIAIKEDIPKNSIEDRHEEIQRLTDDLEEKNIAMAKELRDNEIANARVDHTALMSGVSIGLPQEKNKEQQANEEAAQILNEVGGIYLPTPQ